LEGLNIKEVKYSFVNDSTSLRLESEFYLSNVVPIQDCYSGEEIISFVQYGTSKELNEDGKGYPVLRLNEFKSHFIGSPAKYCDLIDAQTYEELRLCKDDVLVCRTNGNPKFVGKAAIVPKNYNFAYASYLFRLRPHKNMINSATLVAYLNSRIGRSEIERYSMVGNQANFSPAKFREMNIPRLNKNINEYVEFVTYKAFSILNVADILYFDAEKFLLSEIGFDEFLPSADNINTKRYSESFLSSGRLDSEYYLPKYDDYLRLVNSYKGGVQPLSEACNLKDKNYSPKDNQEYQYIELSNIGNSGEVTGCLTSQGKDLPSRARRIVGVNDVIVSSIEGSLESCAIVPKAYDGALCSTGFYVLNSNQLNSETLLILFKSNPIQALLKQNCSGTILTAINKTEFLNIPIPLIDKDVQKEIQEKLKESISQREKSESLLEIAKRAVEIAIEVDEPSAERYIHDECQKLNIDLNI
jgi:type I restriction enzyme, S subunit